MKRVIFSINITLFYPIFRVKIFMLKTPYKAVKNY